jgi:hypothetical protein
MCPCRWTAGRSLPHETRFEGARVVNVFPYRVVEVEAPAGAAAPAADVAAAPAPDATAARAGRAGGTP